MHQEVVKNLLFSEDRIAKNGHLNHRRNITVNTANDFESESLENMQPWKKFKKNNKVNILAKGWSHKGKKYQRCQGKDI